MKRKKMKFATPESMWTKDNAEQRMDRLASRGVQFEPEDIGKSWSDLPEPIRNALS